MATSRNKNNNYNPTGKHKSKRNVVRYFTKDNLKKAILHAENTDKARSVYSDTVFAYIKDHDKNIKYPVIFLVTNSTTIVCINLLIMINLFLLLLVDIRSNEPGGMCVILLNNNCIGINTL